MPTIAVIGAGIAGLTAAYQLQQSGLDVVVVEASPCMGGVIRSERIDGYLVEHGPNTIQTGSATLNDLIDQLELQDQIVEANPAAKRRYVVRNGEPLPLPSTPPALFTTRLFSPRARLRVLKEPFISPTPPGVEESVAAFVRRRLGDEILDYAVDPFVAGIFAGDPEQLSARHAFPRLYDLQQQHGSLIGGQIRRMRTRTPGSADSGRKRRMFSFHDGLQTLPYTLAGALSGKIQTEACLAELRRSGDKWTVIYTKRREPHVLRADAVLLTIPLHRLPGITLSGANIFASLGDTVYAPVRVVTLGYEAERVRHPLDGFGVLVPSVEAQFQILGVLFSSTLFPDRAPAGNVLLTTFLGGARHPELARGSEEQALSIARRDVSHLLGVRGDPRFVHHVQWTHAIPQYLLGYGHIKDAINRIEDEHPGLYFAGNFRNGISLADTVATATSVAHRIAQQFG